MSDLFYPKTREGFQQHAIMKKISWLLIMIPLASFHIDNEGTIYKNYIGSWSSDGKQILFYSDRNGNWDIYLVALDGSGLKQITHAKANETEPNWHPKQNQFVFTSDKIGDRKIYSYDLETNDIVAITNSSGQHSSPVWSPEGTHLAYLSYEGDQWKLCVMKLSDATLYVVYQGPTYPGRATWSPSGTEVMFSIAVNGKETLHFANIEGKVMRTFVPGFNSCGNAAMSPNGSQIVFDAHSEDVLDSGDGKWELYLMNISDNSIVRLTNNDKDDWGGRWSPDGSKLIFLGSGFNNTGYELFVMDSDGSNVVQLTDR